MRNSGGHVSYRVIRPDGETVISGDDVTSLINGKVAKFVRVSRGPEHNGVAKIEVDEPDTDRRSYYTADEYNLFVVVIREE